MRGNAEHGFERDVPIKTAVVAEDEFFEIGVDVFSAQAVIGAEAPAFQQREDPMNPRQHDMARHFANHARIVPVVAGQTRIGCVAVSEQRGSRLHIGPDESFDRGGGIIRDHGEADAAGTRIEVFCVFASRFGPVCVAIDHLDRACDKDFSSVARLEESIADPEWNFCLIDFDDAFERFAVWIDHGSPQLLRQKPSCLVGEAELIFELPRRHAVGMRRHEMRGPEPRRQRQLGAMHRRARRNRSLASAIETFECVCPALQRHRAAGAAARADKAIPPSPFEQERGAARLVGKSLLELGKRPRLGHRVIRRHPSRRLTQTAIPHLDEPGTTG